MLPIPPTALQLSTGVAVLSYGDELVFGITADYDAGTRHGPLAAGIELGMAHLVALSQDSVLLFTKDAASARGRCRARDGGVSATGASAALTQLDLSRTAATVRRWVVPKLEPVTIDPRRHDAVLFDAAWTTPNRWSGATARRRRAHRDLSGAAGPWSRRPPSCRLGPAGAPSSRSTGPASRPHVTPDSHW